MYLKKEKTKKEERRLYHASSGIKGELQKVDAIQATLYLCCNSKWGAPHGGGDGSGVASKLFGVTSIHAMSSTFIAISNLGALILWGKTTAFLPMHTVTQMNELFDEWLTCLGYGSAVDQKNTRI